MQPTKHREVPTNINTYIEFGSIVFALFLMFSFISSPVHAQWRIAPSLAVGVEYDDNPTINESVSDSVTGYLVNAEATFTKQTQLSEFFITPQLRSRQYDDARTLDANDEFLRIGYSYSSQRAGFGFRGSYAKESIRTAERAIVDFDVEDPDEIPDDDSGRVQDSQDRQRTRLAPVFTYKTGQRSSIAISATYLDLQYPDDVSSELNDFTSTRVLGRYNYAWTERDTISLAAYRQNFDIGDESASDRSGSGFSAGYVRDISENTRFRANIGIDRTEDLTGEDQSNAAGELSLTRSYETLRLLAAYQRTVSGGGGNNLYVRDAISFQLRKDISAKFTLGAGIRAYKTDSLRDGVTTFEKRDYVQFRALSNWRLTKTFSIDLDYRFTSLERDLVPGNNDSNSITIWLRYAPIF